MPDRQTQLRRMRARRTLGSGEGQQPVAWRTLARTAEKSSGL
jgi:hypothetical protein